MKFYTATRDIDCEAHYFANLTNALIYVWTPMGNALREDKTKGYLEGTELYNKFRTSGSTNKMWELDAPREWGAPYNQLGGFIEYCTCEDTTEDI